MRAIVRLMSVPQERRDLAWLQDALQAAIQLELGTIPPYLYAYWSLAESDAAGSTILEIAIEEMQHMGQACNLLASVGGHPDILKAVSTYPASLPKDIHQGLDVKLEAFSKAVLLNTFMAIEEPQAHIVDDPDFEPSGTRLIGDFYDAVETAFVQHAPNPLVLDTQVDISTVGFNPGTIVSLDAMREAVGLIKRQGEGSAASPFEREGELAHFYQFGEIFHEKRLKQIQENPPRFAYTGDSLAVPTDRALPIGGEESKAFNIAYSDMLRTLQQAWDLGATGVEALQNAVFLQMGSLDTVARDLVATGKGPAFLLVDSHGDPTNGRDPMLGRFSEVRAILDTAVGAGTFGAHGPFWRGKTRDQFVQLKVFGQQLLIVGNGRDSNLIKSLRGQKPFGSDTGTSGATFRRMPAGRAAVPSTEIDVIERWINEGCPDDAPQMRAARLSLTSGAQRVDPLVHVAFWRDFDDWAMFHATPDIQEAIGVVFELFPAWQAVAQDPAMEQKWTDALAPAPVRSALALLAARQKHTVESHYYLPVPLLTILDGFERFGSDLLPDDDLRPEDPRHNMNGAIMWFIWSAFADASVHLDLPADFWRFYMRAILCGLLNDGVFRGRFTVLGFSPTEQDRLKIFTYCQTLRDADLVSEMRRRYVESGF